MSALIVIDAGHGGTDPGALGWDGTRESDLALAVANALHVEMIARGFRAHRTREKDVNVGLGTRAKVANLQVADVFVSIHMNSSLNTTANGCWVLHAEASKKGKALAKSIYTAMAPGKGEKVFPDGSPWTGKRRLAVLQQTNMPAALVECAFISNPSDLADMKEPGWPQKTAVKIADGIQAWLGDKGEEAA